MLVKPQDIVVALSFFVIDAFATYAEKGRILGMSASEVHAAESRLVFARLLVPLLRRVKKEPFLKFLIHGVPYAYPVAPEGQTRGVPTAWAAPVLCEYYTSVDQMVPVWPDPEGSVQGAAVKPLYRSVPRIAKESPNLYELLALVDALRIGRARERRLAEEKLYRLLEYHGTA